MNYGLGLIDLDASNRSNDRIINYVLLRVESGWVASMIFRERMVQSVLVKVVLDLGWPRNFFVWHFSGDWRMRRRDSLDTDWGRFTDFFEVLAQDRGGIERRRR